MGVRVLCCSLLGRGLACAIFASLSLSIISSYKFVIVIFQVFTHYTFFSIIWASSQENLSSGFPTNRDSNQFPHLQRPTKKNEISLTASLNIILSKNQIPPRLICAFVVRKPPKTGFLVLRAIQWDQKGNVSFNEKENQHCSMQSGKEYQKGFILMGQENQNCER